MTLTDYLTELAARWCDATGRTTGALSTLVVNDAKTFDRISRGGSVTLPVFERYLRYFRDASNWPGMTIPLDVADLLDRLDAIATETAAASPDNGAADIGAAA